MGLVQVERRNEIAIFKLDNPPLNVMSIEMGIQIADAIATVKDDDSVMAVIVTGAGSRAFMAGADIKEFPRYFTENIAEEMSHAFSETLQALHHLGKPTIAALNGLTLGGGCEVAMSCDFRVAEDHVMIGLPEMKLGLFPGAGGTQRLPRLIGESRAKELILTGEPITAEEAYRIGLVNRVVGPGEALEASLAFAHAFSQKSLQSLRRAKQAIDEGLELSLDEGLKLEARLFGDVFQTSDAREGVDAFIQKRPPNFTHK